MPKIQYIERRFSRQWLEVITIANQILVEYEKQGYDLTLRGLYYKFVGGNLFPEDRRYTRDERTGKWKKDPKGTKNAEPNYKWLGDIINDARLAGLIDWNHIRDRTREIKDLTHFVDEGDAVKKTAAWYWIDLWENQGVRPEVWVEKDAQVGNMIGVCQELDVPLFSCRGYTSQSAMWKAAQRLKRHQDEGFDTHIIHLGDHDPSGVDMSRDIFARMEMFMGGTEFNRIALNMSQVREQDLPPDPAKVTDSRAKAYIQKFGEESWEMDALEPSYINDLVREAVVDLRDEDQWHLDMKRHQEGKDHLETVARKFPKLRKFLNNEEAVLGHLYEIRANLEAIADPEVGPSLDDVCKAIDLLR